MSSCEDKNKKDTANEDRSEPVNTYNILYII